MPIYSTSGSVIIVQQPHNSRSTVTRIYGSSPKDRSTNPFLYSSSPVEDGYCNDDSDSDMSSTEDCSEDECALADYGTDDDEEDFNFNGDNESGADPVNIGFQPPATFIDDVAFAEIPFWFNNEEEGKQNIFPFNIFSTFQIYLIFSCFYRPNGFYFFVRSNQDYSPAVWFEVRLTRAS